MSLLVAGERIEDPTLGPAHHSAVRTDLDLVAAADRNFLGSFRKLIEHIPDGAVADFGGVFAFRTGLPIGLYNGCVVDHPASSAAVVAALDWIGDDLPHLLWIHDELADPLGSIGRDRGMERESWQTPQMILGPPPTMPEPAPGVTVLPVTNTASLEEFVALIGGGSSSDVARRLIPATLAADADVLCLTAYLDGRPAGTAIAIRTGAVSGVYAVGTLPEARRRGVATAATWAAVDAGRAWGCETVALQSTEMGFPVYAAMGFRTVVRYTVFRRAPDESQPDRNPPAA